MLLLTLRGTPTLYYGDEIGMTNVAIPPERVRDPLERNVPGMDSGATRRERRWWSAAPNAGFGAAAPWLPLGADWRSVNVAAQREDERSMLALYRSLIALRRREPALALGRYRPAPAEGDVLAYLRSPRGHEPSFLVALNLGSKPQRLAQAGSTVACFPRISTARTSAPAASWSCAPTKDSS